MPHLLQPKLLTTLRGYSRAHFLADITAGLTVGLVALPLAIAFGIASIPDNVAAEAGISPPAMGLFTAIVAGFLISALGGTRVSIGGPTGAFVVIVYAIAAEHGYAGLCIATIMAGLILIAMGALGLGAFIKFIPYPVTTGFTTGIAVIIFSGQIKDLLGLEMGPLPPDFLNKCRAYITHIHSTDRATAAVGLLCAAFVFLWPRLVTRKVPGAILALVGATLANRILHLDLETIGSRFGAIPTTIPLPTGDTLRRFVPDHWSDVKALVGPALTIALLGGIESLLCAVVADGMTGSRHRSNAELMAQGIANVASPFFGGIPATSAIARTATNIQAGAKSPVAGIVHAATLFVIVVAAGKHAAHVPMCALAAVLVVVSWNMAEAHRFFALLRGPRADGAVLMTTFLLTVLTDLTVAVEVGMVLAAVLFIKRMSDITSVASLKPDEIEDAAAEKVDKPRGVEVYDINGPFFFGAAYKLRDTLDALGDRPRVLILHMPNVTSIDATGLYALEELRARCAREKMHVILAGVHAQPLFRLTQSGALDAFGTENLTGTLPEAIERARALLAAPTLRPIPTRSGG